jgi:7-carboxy-7-deazaguanine synthase
VSYFVKEMFLTLQGEGANVGKAAVFCRFAGCNLWSGREEHRASATCRFCDTDFVGVDGPGGGRFATAEQLAAAVRDVWGPQGSSDGAGAPFIVCTGGEPLLQLDPPLIAAFHAVGFEIAIETNGTLVIPDGIDWVCVSPKAGAALVVYEGNELKLVYPQAGGEPELYTGLGFDHFLLQPMDGPDKAENTRRAIDYCLHHSRWRLSVQTHKYLGIP